MAGVEIDEFSGLTDIRFDRFKVPGRHDETMKTLFLLDLHGGEHAAIRINAHERGVPRLQGTEIALRVDMSRTHGLGSFSPLICKSMSPFIYRR
jgi:hypothetical protein